MNSQTADDGNLDIGISVAIEHHSDELTVVHDLLQLDHKEILELGCGQGESARAIAQAGHDRSVLALEVDEIQHALNLQLDEIPRLRFGLAGAEAIPAAEASFDVVFMFKSLHHVPVASMDRALAEITRVLRPGGFACICEPIYRGDFNELLRIFHDERQVRCEAFAAIVRAVHSRALELVSQTFFLAPLHFAKFDDFEQLVIRATHSSHVLSDATWEEVRATFAKFTDEHGARFAAPTRIDLLRKP